MPLSSCSLRWRVVVPLVSWVVGPVPGLLVSRILLMMESLWDRHTKQPGGLELMTVFLWLCIKEYVVCLALIYVYVRVAGAVFDIACRGDIVSVNHIVSENKYRVELYGFKV